MFSKKIAVLIGKNGVGKTNILEAIYYLGVFRSFLNYQDQQLIHFDTDFFRIESYWEDDYKVVAKYQSKKKTIEINDVKVVKYSEYFGHIPIVLSSPSDIFLFFGGGEERRKFIDYTISVYDKVYLQDINLYQQYLDHRNALLKSSDKIDISLIAFYNEKMAQLGNAIFDKRRNFLNSYISRVNQWYQVISDKNDWIEIYYESQLIQDNLLQLLRDNIDKDILLKRTTKGIHRDDLSIEMSGIDIKKIASQGQQKSLLYAMRIAQAEWIYDHTQIRPIFLLDDFSDKLDEKRSARLLESIQRIDFVQQWMLTDIDAKKFENITDLETFYIG